MGAAYPFPAHSMQSTYGTMGTIMLTMLTMGTIMGQQRRWVELKHMLRRRGEQTLLRHADYMDGNGCCQPLQCHLDLLYRMAKFPVTTEFCLTSSA